MYNGIINIYKEKGFTSFDVVAKMRGICGQKKIGHTGTLDPDAEGVLPVCLGNGTKLCELLTDHDKEYIAELLLGVKTDTQDITGTVLEKRPVEVSTHQVQKAVFSFKGTYLQVPPMYSAIKVNGKKLYELARAGREVERQARPVTIRELDILEIQLPVVKLRVVCSKGTYIRTLCDDIGKSLGCGGTMLSLLRTRVGGFRIEDSIRLGELETLKAEGGIDERVISADYVFRDAPALHVKPAFRKLLENGNAFYADQTLENKIFSPDIRIRVYVEERFYGLFAYDEGKKRYQPVKMFL